MDTNMIQEQSKIKANIVHQNLLRKRGMYTSSVSIVINQVMPSLLGIIRAGTKTRSRLVFTFRPWRYGQTMG